jgi:hypothetical protein
MNLRSGSERVNAVNDSYKLEGASRNADRGLVRLFFANFVQHAVIRYNEALKAADESERPLPKRRVVGDAGLLPVSVNAPP